MRLLDRSRFMGCGFQKFFVMLHTIIFLQLQYFKIPRSTPAIATTAVRDPHVPTIQSAGAEVPENISQRCSFCDDASIPLLKGGFAPVRINQN